MVLAKFSVRLFAGARVGAFNASDFLETSGALAASRCKLKARDAGAIFTSSRATMVGAGAAVGEDPGLSFAAVAPPLVRARATSSAGGRTGSLVSDNTMGASPGACAKGSVTSFAGDGTPCSDFILEPGIRGIKNNGMAAKISSQASAWNQRRRNREW